MKGILGMVTVAATTVVKAVALVGIAAGALMLGMDALAMVLPEGAFGNAFPNPSAREMLTHALPFIAGFAGWRFAEWTEGSVRVIENQAKQEAALRKLESYHGVAL